MRKKQRTINKQVSLTGVGLHTGRKCKVQFIPAKENEGIKFIRRDLPDRPLFLAQVEKVVDVVRGTTLGSMDNRIYTIEHVLSALNGLGIDNVLIEIDDSEPPVCDGSAKEIVDVLLSAGIVEQSASLNYFTVDSPFEYISNKTLIRVEPSDAMEIECEVDYEHPHLKKQTLRFTDKDDYSKEIAPARTYCFDYEIEALKKRGLAKGGSLDNAIVVGPTGVYNPGSFLRFEDEFVRHKVLDLMGDLMLLGLPLKAKVIAKRCGHGHNINFLKQLLRERQRPSPISVG
ncbi:UDP-3-O-[3-hydroxymyristoyl] N-acetylglucosamine deacetylase [bacterium F11]|nr:UDP-3-O-[3-hydroxymyristoyl] N-acetylglucosamine deacetylase [bacterium F11]